MKQTGRSLGGGAMPSELAPYYHHGSKLVQPDGKWVRYIWKLSSAKTGYYLNYHVYEPVEKQP